MFRPVCRAICVGWFPILFVGDTGKAVRPAAGDQPATPLAWAVLPVVLARLDMWGEWGWGRNHGPIHMWKYIYIYVCVCVGKNVYTNIDKSVCVCVHIRYGRVY